MYNIEFENIKTFLLGGKANFIVRNKTNDKHLNFTINKSKKKETNKKTYFVNFKSTNLILIGNIVIYNNKLTYFYPNIKIDIDAKKVFDKLFYFIFIKNQYPNNVEILYTGECCRCGQILTNPIYIEQGIGKQCLETYNGIMAYKKLL